MASGGDWALTGEQEPYRMQAEREASQEDGDGKLTFLCVSWDMDPFPWGVGHLLVALMG